MNWNRKILSILLFKIVKVTLLQKMADETPLSTSYDANPNISINKEVGLLDGVGNEVLIGLLCVIFFIWFSKYILDVYMFPVSQINNGDTPSVTSNQGMIQVLILHVIWWKLVYTKLPINVITYLLGRTRPTGNNYDCSICLGSANYAIETNCGHIFCGECIFQYYEITPRAQGK